METPIIIGTPETGNLSTTVSLLGKELYSKRGGLGDVIPILANKIPDARILMPNFKNFFMEQNNMDVEQWNDLRHKTSTGQVHMIDSHYISQLKSPYDGDQARTAAIFQARSRTILKNIRSEHQKQLIYISNDWMTAGYLSAYLRKRNIPILHMIHNIHTQRIPLKLFEELDVGVDEFKENFYIDREDHNCIDSNATGIKNADYVGIVSHSFLMEIVRGEFSDKIPASIREEIIAKYEKGRAIAMPNGLYEDLLPEHQQWLFDKYKEQGAVCFNPDTPDILESKIKNMIAFQKITQQKHYDNSLKTDENATLLFWPSRFEEFQKGAELLVNTAWDFIQKNPDVQIAIVADPAVKGGDIDVNMRNMALNSDRIFYTDFDKDLSKFGYSAASAVISAPVFEPYGFFIPQGLAAGALILVTNVGGGKEMVKEYNPISRTGNGIHIQEHSNDAFRLGLDEILLAHRHLKTNPELANKEIKRIMIEARQDRGTNSMIKGYVNIINTLKEQYGLE
jgi:glycogen synthase